MNVILKSISYIFHPLFMPLIGVLYYFKKTPRHFPDTIIKAKVIILILLTVLLPILLFFLLKSLGKIKSFNLPNTKERVLPLGLNTIIILFILKRVLPFYEFSELYFFFLGILISTLTCLILVIANFKASIHMIAISGTLMFFIALSIHFNKNINFVIAILFLITGAIASSRLHMKAHTSIELFIGFCIGFIPQLVLLNYWL